jgi:hypothetical protein
MLPHSVEQVVQRMQHACFDDVRMVSDRRDSRAHKAKSVRHFVQHQVKDRLRLFFLPPYSPDINPDELIWNDVKSNGAQLSSSLRCRRSSRRSAGDGSSPNSLVHDQGPGKLD